MLGALGLQPIKPWPGPHALRLVTDPSLARYPLSCTPLPLGHITSVTGCPLARLACSTSGLLQRACGFAHAPATANCKIWHDNEAQHPFRGLLAFAMPRPTATRASPRRVRFGEDAPQGQTSRRECGCRRRTTHCISAEAAASLGGPVPFTGAVGRRLLLPAAANTAAEVGGDVGTSSTTAALCSKPCCAGHPARTSVAAGLPGRSSSHPRSSYVLSTSCCRRSYVTQ